MTPDEFKKAQHATLKLVGAVSGKALELAVCPSDDEPDADGRCRVYVNEDAVGFDIYVNLADLELVSRTRPCAARRCVYYAAPGHSYCDEHLEEVGLKEP
jgi:hypothetical protein